MRKNSCRHSFYPFGDRSLPVELFLVHSGTMVLKAATWQHGIFRGLSDLPWLGGIFILTKMWLKSLLIYYFRKNYYYGLSKAYLRKEIAIKLSKAQKILKTRHPDYSLLILDAARPRSVTRLMYDKMKGTKFEKYCRRQ